MKKELGEKLRQWRLAKGITVEQLAVKFGTCAGTIGRWERGETGVSKIMRIVLRTEQPDYLAIMEDENGKNS